MMKNVKLCLSMALLMAVDPVHCARASRASTNAEKDKVLAMTVGARAEFSDVAGAVCKVDKDCTSDGETCRRPDSTECSGATDCICEPLPDSFSLPNAATMKANKEKALKEMCNDPNEPDLKADPMCAGKSGLLELGNTTRAKVSVVVEALTNVPAFDQQKLVCGTSGGNNACWASSTAIGEMWYSNKKAYDPKQRATELYKNNNCGTGWVFGGASAAVTGDPVRAFSPCGSCTTNSEGKSIASTVVKNFKAEFAENRLVVLGVAPVSDGRCTSVKHYVIAYGRKTVGTSSLLLVMDPWCFDKNSETTYYISEGDFGKGKDVRCTQEVVIQKENQKFPSTVTKGVAGFNQNEKVMVTMTGLSSMGDACIWAGFSVKTGLEENRKLKKVTWDE